jgi:Cu2+-exporting ATPase
MVVFELALVGSVTGIGIAVWGKHSTRPTLGKVLSGKDQQNASTNPTSLARRVRAAQRSFLAKQAARYNPRRGLLHNARRDQLVALDTSSEQPESNAEEHEINTLLKISAGTLAGTIIGKLFYPPLIFLSIIPLAYTFYPYFRSGYQALFRERKITMSVVDVIVMPGMVLTGYVVAAALDNTLLLLSRKLVVWSEEHSHRSLVDVLGQQPQAVLALVDGAEREVPVETLQVNDVVVVHAGEMVPVDGTIIDGIATIDQHMLTGEAQPIDKGVGDAALASTILLTGKVHIAVERAGQDTAAARIGDILQRTADFKLSIQSRGEAIADQSALPTLALSAVALPLLGVNSALAILFSGVGYNMRIMAPLSLLNFLQIMSHNGILIKDGRSLEVLQQVDTVVFDKTGTLTLEQPYVQHIYTWNGYNADDLLTCAAAAEYRQTHPIARAILQAAEERGLNVPHIEDAHYEVGYGIKVRLANQVIRVGSDRFMEVEGIPVSATVYDLQAHCHTTGHSLILVAVDDDLAGGIELQRSVRPEVPHIINKLQQYGIQMYIMSGDQEQPTRSLAHELGIKHFFANTLPENKAQLIQQLQDEGRTVCFVGDGINDSIALKQANVSVSMRGATTIATDTAKIVLMDGNLNQLVRLFDLSRDFERNMQTNLMMTIIPGVICIGGIFFFHFGLIAAVVLYNASLGIGVLNTMVPIVQHHLYASQKR